WLPFVAVAVALGLRWGLRRPGLRLRVERAGFRAPAVGPLLRHFHTTRLLLNLGTLLNSRVPLLDAVAIAEGFVPRALYGAFFAELRQNIEAGRGVSPAFASSGLFPATVIEMIQTGESSSALDRIM